MFLSQNLTSNTENRFPSRDQLLSFLEQENARLRVANQGTTYTLTQIDDNGQVLQKTRLNVPFQETIEELLQHFGFVQPANRSKLALLKLKKPKATDPSSQSASQAASEASDSRFTPLKLLAPVLVLLLLLGVYTAHLAGQHKTMAQKVTTLTKQTEQLSRLQAETGRADVFGRYFVASFYANDKGLMEHYLTDDLKEDIKVKDGQLSSAVFESIEAKGKEYQLTYVLNVSQEEDVRTVRLTFRIRKAKDSRYGYHVTSQPKESLYPG